VTSRLFVTPLGGVGQFGRNCMAIGRVDDAGQRDVLIVDAGIRFLGNEGYGFDAGLPDLRRLQDLGDDVLAYIVTHGHEDHIGGLPACTAVVPAPIYATPYTTALIERRYQRNQTPLPRLEQAKFHDVIEVGPFRVRYFAVSHSIPDASVVVIECDAGRVVHSGDFRVDIEPLEGAATDLPGLTAVGDEGVDVLLADSTSAATPGMNPGERSVIPALVDVMAESEGLVVIASFGTHLSRMAAVCEAAKAAGRAVFICGRSLKNTASLGRKHRPGLVDEVQDVGALNGHLRSRSVVIVTGTQGEPQATLAKLARAQHPKLKLEEGDRVVLSSRVIPGNERSVAHMLDALSQQGIDTRRVDGAHVSGHGHRDDLRELLMATRPRHFVAVHGGGQQLVRHRDVAADLGLDPDHIHPILDGETLWLHDGEASAEGGPPALEPYLTERAEVCHSPQPVVRARRQMSRHGVAHALIEDGQVRLFLHGVYPVPDDKALRQMGRRAFHAFFDDDHAAEFDDDANPYRAVARFLRARLADCGCGPVEVSVHDDRPSSEEGVGHVDARDS